MQRFTTSAAAAALILAMAGSAFAAPAKKPVAASGPVSTQATAPRAAPAAALPPINHGPPIANVCIYADERAVGSSLVGKAASARMQQLRAQVTAELQAENTSLQTDASALNAKKATLPSQGQALQARADALNAKAGQRQRELEATGAEALGQIHQRIDNILRAVYQQRGCSLLLNGDSVYLANPAMDVTSLVTAQLDAAMPTITFDRKVLPAQAQQ
jgi:Skp family chaperone for outer membrane proteins